MAKHCKLCGEPITAHGDPAGPPDVERVGRKARTGGRHRCRCSRPAESRGDASPGLLLVEGKSYPEELYAAGCQAEADSRKLIERSLAWTHEQLGVADKTPADWCGSLYQTANRLAHFAWMRSLGVRVWLVHLLFVDDPHRPTTADDGGVALRRANEELGIGDRQLPGVGHVLLEAGTREELVEEGPPSAAP